MAESYGEVKCTLMDELYARLDECTCKQRDVTRSAYENRSILASLLGEGAWSGKFNSAQMKHIDLSSSCVSICLSD